MLYQSNILSCEVFLWKKKRRKTKEDRKQRWTFNNGEKWHWKWL